MEQHYKNFLTLFYKFLYDLNRYTPNDNLKKVLDIYNNLDIAKIIFRTYHLLKDNFEQIKKRDEALFTKEFFILPEIDVSQSWLKLIKGQKEKLWTYLNILMIESEILVNFKEESKNLSTETQIQTQIQTQTQTQTQTNSESIDPPSLSKEKNEQPEFNPYLGIGNAIQVGDTYGVNEMFSSIPTFEDDKPDGPGIDTIANIIGINKMINLEELTNQLKNMKKEDIENATNNIKGLLGSNINEKTAGIITDMLSDISEELKKSEMSKGDPLKNIFNVAETVASRMKPKMNQENLSQLINSTQIFADQCKDKNGNSMFGDKMNPFALLGQFANNLNQENVSEEQCNKQCNDLLKNLGLNNVDFNQLTSQLQNGMLGGKNNINNNKMNFKKKKGKKRNNK